MKNIRKILRENLESYDQEMSGTRKRGQYTPTPREKEVGSVFGDYADDVPPSVLRYMRKNTSFLHVGPKHDQLHIARSSPMCQFLKQHIAAPHNFFSA